MPERLEVPAWGLEVWCSAVGGSKGSGALARGLEGSGETEWKQRPEASGAYHGSEAGLEGVARHVLEGEARGRRLDTCSRGGGSVELLRRRAASGAPATLRNTRDRKGLVRVARNQGTRHGGR